MSEISNLIVEGKMYFLSQRTLLEINVMLITLFYARFSSYENKNFVRENFLINFAP